MFETADRGDAALSKTELAAILHAAEHSWPELWAGSATEKETRAAALETGLDKLRAMMFRRAAR